MKETKHTPGPWVVEERSLNISVGPIRDPGVCRVYGLNDLGRANARLIAAAPEMLKALQLVSSHIDPDQASPFAAIVGAAIAKATQP